MREIKIIPHNGRDTLFVRETPNLKILSKQDYTALITSLELDIRNYYKEQEQTAEQPDKPPP
ncbi:MAG: hypothetical protein K2P32_00895 [Clostridia bacterium]|nr:hypothetical protein [Clostridia bacterium]